MRDEESSHDFGKDIIPKLVKEDREVYACPFEGYWVDVGTIPNYYDVSMDLLNPDSKIWEMNWDMKILSSLTPCFKYIDGNIEEAI
jgi:glucose-1-phosphate adenylyltransferase